jgi:ADP-heptose:LPS heptosyltransferase
MARNVFSKLLLSIFKRILSVPENSGFDLGNPKKFLIVRQHNQLGDLLAGVSVFRAIKETYPESQITLVLSPFNYQGLVKNRYLDRIFIFDKKKIFNPFYLKKLINLLKENYDVAIVPVTVSISFTSNLIARLSNSKIRIGPRSLDGKKNVSDFFFDRKVTLDWRMHPDSNVSERILDIVRPFGIDTKDYSSEISFDTNDINAADEFIKSLNIKEGDFLIGLHVGAGKISNRWSLIKYVTLIKQLNENYPAKFYLTASSSDKELFDFVIKELPFKIGLFINRKIPEIAALISRSYLFISNDTGIMHVAGTTDIPQVSIFGPTNPFNWAPIGANKHFIRKSELIDDVSVEDVFSLCSTLIAKTCLPSGSVTRE